jgi:hypothetical protein
MAPTPGILVKAWDFPARFECSNRFQNSQTIRRLHLHHRRVKQASARAQTHVGRALDDVIIGKQTTIVRDDKACAGAALFKFPWFK